MNAKHLYRELCKEEPTIPLFSQAWWLDATAGPDGWDVAIVESGGKVVASLPYITRRRYAFTKVSQPKLTQHLGPWLRIDSQKKATVSSRQVELLDALIDRLPRFSQYEQNWHHSQTNWLPFHWRGFEQTTCYTYVITDLSNENAIWQNLRSNLRREIKKAQDRHSLTIRTDLGIKEFSTLNKMVFQRQNISVPYDDALLRRLDSACVERGRRQIFIAEDSNGRHHAAVYIVWDDYCAYYLMGGGDPALRSSGATSLCMWKAILFSATVSSTFDFEGSMLKPVERYFRSFGAAQVPYFRVKKTESKLLKIYDCLKSL